MYLRSFLIFLVSAFLISCSTVYEVEIVPTEEAISRQEGMLKGIHIGQAKAEVDKLVTLPKYNSFDVKEGDNTYAFQQTTNNETNVGFGFYFENDKLSAVLSDDDTAKLSSCRSLFRTNAKHWLEYGIKPYADWIKARNSMSQDFNYREFRTRTEVRRNKLDTALGNPLTIVAYSPAIVLASPVIIHDQITGESEKKRIQIQKKFDLSKSIKIGDTRQYIKEQLGWPDRVDTVQDNLVFTYSGPSISYGIENDVVVWKETYSMIEVYYRQLDYGGSFHKNIDCGELDVFWEANKQK